MKNLIQMKTLAITFVTLTCTFFAQTGMAMGDSIPKDARLVQHINVLDNVITSNPVDYGDTAIAEFEHEHHDEMETKCREIIYDWNMDSHHHLNFDTLNSNSFYRTVNLSINAYCAPRPESQKYIKSVELSCEKNPTEECVKLAPQFDAVTPTTSRNLHKPN